MAWQVFGTLTAGNQNLSLFDTLTAQIAKEVVISTTMTGTNAITMAGTTNAPAIAAYSDYVQFSGFPANTTTGVVTARYGTLAFLKVFLDDGSTQATTNDITANYPIGLMYLSSLDSANGGFYLLKSAVQAATNIQVSTPKVSGCLMFNNAVTPSTKIDITAQQGVLATTSGLTIFRSAISVTCDLTTTGANGMDTGSRPTSGWVYMYLIDNGSAVASLGTATSPTSAGPSMPGGYTYNAFIGAMWLDGSQNLFRSRQDARKSQYTIVASTNTATVPNMASGTTGSYSTTSPTLATQAIAAFVPLTAGSINVAATNLWKAGTIANVLVAANTGYGGTNNGPQGSTGQTYPIWLNAGNNQMSSSAWIQIETTSIAWASSAGGGAISCLGWDDYYSAC